MGIKMLNIAVCDDENAMINDIENMLLDVCKKQNIRADIDVFCSGETLGKEVMMGTKYDMIFLDIEMEKVNGIESAKAIRKMDQNVIFIYVSAHDRYALELFCLDVFAFIKKPIDKEEFRKTFLGAYQRVCNKVFYFTFNYKNEEYKIPCKDILYFESRGRKINIYHLNGRVDEFYGKLSEVETKIAKGKIPFLRIHQSYLVNFLLIRARTKVEVILVNGEKLIISEDRQKKFAKEYSDLLGGEIGCLKI